MTRILIADDHRVVAEGIARIIENSQIAKNVFIAGSIDDAVRQVGEHQPDLILLDVALPDGDGIDAIPKLKAACPQMRIVLFTMYAEAAVIHRALENGVDGYLLKSIDTDELLLGLQKAADGEQFICQEAQAICKNAKEVTPVLTIREREVLALIVEGKTIKEIADQLCLGFETVHSYTKYLRQKLNCPNTAALVRVAMEQHLVS